MPTEDIDVRIRVTGEAEMRALASRLREAGRGELQAKLRRNLRAAGQPVIADLRAAVLGVQVTSTRGGTAPPSYSRDLRRKVARNVRMSVAYRGIRFNVQTATLDLGRYGPALVRYLDAELPGYRNWRHPVFGKDVWTVQRGRPWFFATIRAHAADFEQACVSAINEMINEIGRN